MEQETNRKVLISVKVSTLVIILLVIIAIVVGILVFKNSDSEETAGQVEKSTTEMSSSDNTSDLENEESSEESNTVIKDGKITARSSGIRTSEALEDTSSILEESEVLEENTIITSDTENEFEELEEETIEEIVEETIITSTPIEDVTISKDMDLTIRTGLSREDFITLIAGVEQDTSGFFEENAGLIYDICEKYSINEIFFCGLISAESGWDIASNHRRTYNYISLMSSGGLIKFSSVEDGLESAAQTLHDKYLTEGGSFYYGTTLAAVKTKFCPASSTWVNLVYQRMQQILN